RSVAEAHVALSRTLTPHHRIHGIGLTLEIEELAGDWEALRAASGEVEEAVDANMATPCRRNPRLLLLCAAAYAEAGDEDEAARLERAADACGMEDSGSVLAGARLRLALLRGDPAAAEPLLDPSPRFGFFAGPAAIVARLDAAAALRDRARVEHEAPPLLQRVRGALRPAGARDRAQRRETRRRSTRPLRGAGPGLGRGADAVPDADRETLLTRPDRSRSSPHERNGRFRRS